MEIILHEAAHWVWAAGGDFIGPDFRQVAFNQPAAMQGWKNYFSLQPFISPDWLRASSASGDSFLAGESAVQIGGPYLGMIDMLGRAETKLEMGIALVPQTAYMGGTSFVIWQYSHHQDEAFELVRFLSTQPTSIPASPHCHELPTRRNALDMPSVENNIFHRVFLQAMQSGRGFPTMRLWGAVEDKLIVVISNIWADVFADPGQDIDACLHKHLDPVAQRLNIVLGN
jgi:ABC-type glycerol-3-phosphate transport system substrate-binding protein